MNIIKILKGNRVKRLKKTAAVFILCALPVITLQALYIMQYIITGAPLSVEKQEIAALMLKYCFMSLTIAVGGMLLIDAAEREAVNKKDGE